MFTWNQASDCPTGRARLADIFSALEALRRSIQRQENVALLRPLPFRLDRAELLLSAAWHSQSCGPTPFSPAAPSWAARWLPTEIPNNPTLQQWMSARRREHPVYGALPDAQPARDFGLAATLGRQFLDLG